MDDSREFVGCRLEILERFFPCLLQIEVSLAILTAGVGRGVSLIKLPCNFSQLLTGLYKLGKGFGSFRRRHGADNITVSIDDKRDEGAARAKACRAFCGLQQDSLLDGIAFL